MLYNPCDTCEYGDCKYCKFYAVQESERIWRKMVDRSTEAVCRQMKTIRELKQELTQAHKGVKRLKKGRNKSL